MSPRRWHLVLAALCCGCSTGGGRQPHPHDATPPVPGVVRDGFDGDREQQESTTTAFANWDPFVDPEGGPVLYEWCLGTAPGGQDVLPWTSVGGATNAACSDLALAPGARIWASVRASDLTGNRSAVATSSGILIVRRQGATTDGDPGAVATAPTTGNPAPTPSDGERSAIAEGGGAPAGPTEVEAPTDPTPRETTVLAQYGITWTFDRAHRAGRFANGDWWVLGPVRIVGIDPPSIEQNGRTRHGSMVDPDPSVHRQGYDNTLCCGAEASRYDPTCNAALGISARRPLELAPGSSLVSTITHAAPGNLPQLQTCAILTCLATEPPTGAFRPPYCGRDKRVRHRADDLDLSRLGRLPPPAECPDIGRVTAHFRRPWLDHVQGWTGRYLHPSENMPDYGREIADLVGTGGLLLQLDLPAEQKRTLLVNMAQLGIDLAGVIANGGRFAPDGGSGSGRKFPILLAGTVLRDPTLLALAAARSADFAEDAQTFHVEETSPGVFNHGHGGYGQGDRGLAEWGNRHADDPTADQREWTADPYRRCCTANAWHGFVLAARIMGLRQAWGHPALFDYVDRHMATEPRGAWTRSWSRFPEVMWDAWREKY